MIIPSIIISSIHTTTIRRMLCGASFITHTRIFGFLSLSLFAPFDARFFFPSAGASPQHDEKMAAASRMHILKIFIPITVHFSARAYFLFHSSLVSSTNFCDHINLPIISLFTIQNSFSPPSAWVAHFSFVEHPFTRVTFQIYQWQTTARCVF